MREKTQGLCLKNSISLIAESGKRSIRLRKFNQGGGQPWWGQVLYGGSSTRPARVKTPYPHKSRCRALFIHDCIPQRPNAFHADFYEVSRHHRANALRRAGSDQVSREQRHGIRNVPDDGIERKDEISRVPVLADLAIDTGFDRDSGRRA